MSFVQFGINLSAQGYVNTRYDAEVDTATTSGYGFDSNTVNYKPALTNNGGFFQFPVTIPAKSGDLYITTDLYPLGTLAGACRSGSYSSVTSFAETLSSVSQTNVPIVYTGVFSSTNSLSTPTSDPAPAYGSQYYMAYNSKSVHIPEASYTGNGEVMTILVNINWISSNYPN